MIKHAIGFFKSFPGRLYYDFKLRNKLIIAFSVLVLLPIVFIGLSSNLISKKYLLESEKNSLKQSMEQLNNTIDNFFEIYMNKSEMIFNSQELQEAIIKENSNLVDQLASHDKIARIIGQLTNDVRYPFMKNSYYFGGSLKVVIYPMNKNLSPDGDGIRSYEDIENEEWCRELHKSGRLFSWQSNVADKNGSHYIAMNRRLLDFNSSLDIAVLRLYIPVERIRNIVEKNIHSHAHGLLFVDDKLKNIVAAGEISKNEDFQRQIMEMKLVEGVNEVSINGTGYIIGYLNSSTTGWKLLYVTPVREITNKIRTITLITLVTVVVSIFMCIIIATLVSSFVTRRINLLVNKTNCINGDNLSIPMEIRGADEIGQLDKNFNSMIVRINTLIHNEYKTKIIANKIRLELLQEQINPHMLYNSLSMIGMIAGKANHTEILNVSNHLINFYKGILNKGKIVSSLRSEIEMVERYIEIMKFVYRLDIDTIIDVDEGILDYYSIKLILQPIVENSIMHGIRPKGGGTIVISGKVINDRIEVIVSDDGIGMERSVMESLRSTLRNGNDDRGYGLGNVIKRINLYYGDSYGVNFEDTPGGGVTVTASIPIITQEEMQLFLINNNLV